MSQLFASCGQNTGVSALTSVIPMNIQDRFPLGWTHWISLQFKEITSWQIDGETVETVPDFILGGSKISADGDCRHEIKTLTPWKESYDQPRQHIKKQRHYFVNKHLCSQGYGFPFGHVWM